VTCPRKTPLVVLYWLTDKVGGPKSKSFIIGKPISCQLQYGRIIKDVLIRLDYLGLHTKLSSRLWAHRSGCAGLLTGRRVFWWVGPTCRDGYEPGRWGFRGTHVSQFLRTINFRFLSLPYLFLLPTLILL
jgi:hypothetical protein